MASHLPETINFGGKRGNDGTGDSGVRVCVCISRIARAVGGYRRPLARLNLSDRVAVIINAYYAYYHHYSRGFITR